jgi:hypothetical protein
VNPVRNLCSHLTIRSEHSDHPIVCMSIRSVKLTNLTPLAILESSPQHVFVFEIASISEPNAFKFIGRQVWCYVYTNGYLITACHVHEIGCETTRFFTHSQSLRSWIIAARLHRAQHCSNHEGVPRQETNRLDKLQPAHYLVCRRAGIVQSCLFCC